MGDVTRSTNINNDLINSILNGEDPFQIG